MNRDQLIQLMDERPASALPVRLAIALLAAPFLAFMAVDLVGRVIHPSPPLRLPWQRETRPFPPGIDYQGTSAGDLLQLAQLPWYDRECAEHGVIPSATRTDESGYYNAPSGIPDPFRDSQRDVTLIGASFMVAGSTFEAGFGSQLEHFSGLEVYNAAWPGRGGLHALLHLLDEGLIGSQGEQFLVLSLVQRSLDSAASGFSHLAARLDSDGTYHPPTARSRARGLAREWLRWNQRFDDYLLKTSPSREWAIASTSHMPPMSLDRGMTSAIKLGRLPVPWDHPVLFMTREMNAVSSTFEDFGGPLVVECLARLDRHCAAKGIRLVVVLIPDKYQVFHDVTAPVNYVPTGRETTGSASMTSVFGRRLTDRGVEVLDLYPVMREGQFESSESALVFLPCDSHWSDHGIELCARHVADHLRR